MKEALKYGSYITLSYGGAYLNGQEMDVRLSKFNILKASNDFQDCVFRVIPVLNHQWVGALVDFDLSNLEQKSKLFPLSQQELKARKEFIHNFEIKLEDEMNSNHQSLLETILFGSSTFHLVHQETLNFLQISFDGLQLVEFPNEMTQFNFQPVYQYQQQRQYVVSNENINICGSKMWHNSRLFVIVRSDDQDWILKTALEGSSHFRINKYQDNVDSINYGDIVAINLSETNLFLNVKNSHDLLKAIVDHQIDRLRGLMGNLKSIIFDFIVGFDDVIERVGVKRIQKLQSTSFWKFENIDQVGGEIEWFKLIRIRHNLSGRYLEIQDGNVFLNEYATENSLFRLLPIESSSCLTKDSYFQIQHYVSGQFLQESKQSLNSSNPKLLKIRKIGFEEHWETKYLQKSVPIVLDILDMLDQRDFQSENQMKEIEYKLKFFEKYQKLVNIFKYIEDFIYNRIITNIQINQKYNQISSLRQDQFRQEPLFVLVFLLAFKIQPEIELSIHKDGPSDMQQEAEYYSYVRSNLNLKKDPQKILNEINRYYTSQLQMLQRLIYQTIGSICKGNRDNQIQFFEFGPLFFSQIMKYQSFTILIMQIMDKNHQIINNLAKIRVSELPQEPLLFQALISNFKVLQSLTNRPDLIRFLASSCSVLSQAVFQNQEIIYKFLKKDDKTKRKILYSIKCDKDRGIIIYLNELFPNSEETTIQDFFEDSFGIDSQKEFIKSLFFLLAQLSLQRNFQFQKDFQDNFSYFTLTQFMFNTKLDEDLRAYLLQLCKNFYLDREPFTIFVKPNLIQCFSEQQLNDDQYDDDNDNDQIDVEEKEVQYIVQQFKEQLIDYLKGTITELYQHGNKEQAYNLLTLEVVRVLHLILQFGLFQKNQTTFFNQLIRSNDLDASKKNEKLEQLLALLAQLLEFDYDYFEACKNEKTQKVSQLKRLRQFRIFNRKLTQPTIKLEELTKESYNIIKDPILQKMYNVRWKLNKFTNKTCSIQTQSSEFEIEIKIEICRIFSYILDLRLDYMIDNSVKFFHQKFFNKIKSKKKQTDLSNRERRALEKQFIILLKEDIMIPGEEHSKLLSFRKQYKDFTSSDKIRHFDAIVDKPFIKILLKSFFFAQNPQLQNQLAELIERFTNSRGEYKMFLNQIQLLISQESQQIHNIMYAVVKRLKNLVQGAQIWLQLDTLSQENSRNEEIMEKVQDKLCDIQNILSRNMGDDLDNQTRSMFINIGGFNLLQKLMYKCLSIIDLNVEVFENNDFNDYDEEFQYKQELGQKILSLFQLCVKNISLAVKNDQKNQEFVFQKVCRQLIKYTLINLGQIEMINELFQKNKSMIPLLDQQDFEYLLEYIKIHGKYPEYLDFFILVAQEQQFSQVHQDILKAIVHNEYYDLDPFGDFRYSTEKFYTHQPNIELYKERFIKLIELLLRNEVQVNILMKLLDILKIIDLFIYLLEKTQEMRNTSLDLQIQDQIIEIKSNTAFIILTFTKQYKHYLSDNKQTLYHILFIETQWLSQQTELQQKAIFYITERFLPLINTLNEYVSQHSYLEYDNTSIMMYAETVLQKYQLLTNQQSQFALYQIHRLLKAFDLDLPDDEQEYDQLDSNRYGHFEKQNALNSANQEITMNSDYQIWDKFKRYFNSSQKVSNAIQSGQLPKAIWQFGSKGESDEIIHDLLVNNQDIMLAMIKFLQFWKANRSQKQSVIFFLKNIYDVIKQDPDRTEIFDAIGGTKIIIILIWEENESDNEYIIQLLVLLKELMHNERAKKSAQILLQQALQSDKFFMKLDILLSQDQEKEQTRLVLEILEIMSKNNPIMQNLFRYQHNNKKSYDLVTKTIELMCKQQLSNFLFIEQCINTIIQLVKGPCQPNQIAISNSKFVEYSIKILTDANFTNELNQSQLIKIKNYCLTILLTLTENNHQDDNIILNLKRITPLIVLQNHYSEVYAQMVQKYGVENYSKEVYSNIANNLLLDSGFKAYIIYCILADQKDEEKFENFESDQQQLLQELLKDNILNELSKFGQQLMKHGMDQLNNLKQRINGRVEEKIQILQKQEKQHKAKQFFKKNTLRIQYLRDYQLYYAYFPKLPTFSFLPEQLKDDFHEKAERISTKTKLNSLMMISDKAQKIMKHQELLKEFFKNHQVLDIFARRGKLWRQLAFYNGLSINIMIILSYSQEPFEGESNINYLRLNDPLFLADKSNYNTLNIILSLGYMNLFFKYYIQFYFKSFLIVFFYLLDKAPVRIQFIWDKWEQNESQLGKVIQAIINTIFSIIVLVSDYDVLYYFLQIVMNIIGITIHPFFFAFHLIDILYLEPLIPILGAVWFAKYKLFFMLVLTILCQYYIALLSYNYFYEFFNVEIRDTGQFRNMCETMWQCLMVTFDWTFKTDGSIGRYFSNNVGQQVEERYLQYLNHYYGQFFYDVVINLSMKIILVMFILGVILSSFSELRAKQKLKQNDKSYKCFICGIERHYLDKFSNSNQGFYNHIKQEHYIWNYLFYICYLRMMDDDKLSGNDIFIKNKLKSNDISWFPISKEQLQSYKLNDLSQIDYKNTQNLIKSSKLLALIKRELHQHIL